MFTCEIAEATGRSDCEQSAGLSFAFALNLVQLLLLIKKLNQKIPNKSPLPTPGQRMR